MLVSTPSNLTMHARLTSDYRQNPTKIYNGVRHQTSMCKAFVKLPRPFGEQSGGARKWAIRAGCETWFKNGGYHPPGPSVSASTRKGGKAKQTARAKSLAVGTSPTSPPEKKLVYEDEAPWSAGPSSGPAYDGTNRPFHGGPQLPPSYSHQGYLPPGYHYVPIGPSPHGYAQGGPILGPNGQPMYMPWAYGAPPPPVVQAHHHARQEGGSSPDYREDGHHRAHHHSPSEQGSSASYEDQHIRSPVSIARRTPETA